MSQEFLTTAEVAKELNLSPRTIRKLCESRKIKFRQITPRRIEIRRDWLNEYLTACTTAPETETNSNLKGENENE